MKIFLLYKNWKIKLCNKLWNKQRFALFVSPFWSTAHLYFLLPDLFGWKRRNNLWNVARKCILCCNPFSFHVEYEKDCYYRARGNFFSFICMFGWEKNLLIYTDQNFDLLDWPIVLKKRLDNSGFPLCFTTCRHSTVIADARKMIRWYIYYF